MNWKILVLVPVLALAGCKNLDFIKKETIETVPSVNIERYMGTWYVIGSIPSFFERNAYNAVQTYSLTDEGIEINYQYNDGGYAEDLEAYSLTGTILDTDSNSKWEVELAWPLSSDYNILYLDSNYTVSVVAHSSRDYVWILSREKTLPNTTYSDLILFLQNRGFNVGKLRRVPQQ